MKEQLQKDFYNNIKNLSIVISKELDYQNEMLNEITNLSISSNNKINKAKNLATRKYRKTVDNAYEDLLLIKSFINDGEKFEELEQEFYLLG